MSDLSSPLLPLLGLLGAALAGGHGLKGLMAPGAPGGRQGRKVQKNSRSSGPHGMAPAKGSDLRIRPPVATSVPSRVPRNIAGMLAWDTVKIDTIVNTSTTGITEVGYSWTAGSHPQGGSWRALFDQYTIVQATVVIESGYPSGATTAPPKCYTALDFDNVGALGSIQSIEDFTTCEETVMSPGKTVMRSVQPCTKVVAAAGSGAVLTRSWIDSSDSSTVFCGIRSAYAATSAVYPINVTVTLTFAFRNHI